MTTGDNNQKKNTALFPTDPIAEAGRKIFARQLRRMLSHEAGSRTGDDIESVHQMRVAIRRMRSLFNLIGPYYRRKTVAEYERGLREIGRALGAIRDLDVLILDLQAFGVELPPESLDALDCVVATLEERRSASRIRLNKHFDSKRYARFVQRIRRLTKRAGRGARKLKQAETPHQLRHVLPLLLHTRLARVKAYDAVLPASEDTTLHALRVECKQLRYALEFFQPILGSSSATFLAQVKAMQEILGRINDIAVFIEYVNDLDDLTDERRTIRDAYIGARDAELIGLREQFESAWKRFNNRASQRLFSDSLLVLR